MSNINPLLTPAEQAHIDAVRAWNESRLQDVDNQHLAPSSGDLTAFLASVDWHKVFIWTARLTVIGFIGYAGYKLVNVWLIYPDWRFIAFLDMHTPMMLFSGLFVFFFLHHKASEIMGIIALFSTVLNALLV